MIEILYTSTCKSLRVPKDIFSDALLSLYFCACIWLPTGENIQQLRYAHVCTRMYVYKIYLNIQIQVYN